MASVKSTILAVAVLFLRTVAGQTSVDYCSLVVDVISICEVETAGFISLPATQQASCLCGSTLGTIPWGPATFDGLASDDYEYGHSQPNGGFFIFVILELAARAVVVRPKNGQKICKPCFLAAFEDEIHETIVANRLFEAGERIAIGASGGKDSTVLASVLKTLNERHGYGLELVLLSIDEGIQGYRDDSLETVKRNAAQYGMQLLVVGYEELYGWTMDEVVAQVGKRGNCTYCGVFRRQALDRGAAMLGIRHVVTGHNADDVAETVMMNLLRGDLPRLARATAIVTASAASEVKRSKPLKYAYEKEIVLYAHHKKLDYFCTECIYSPEAFRGSARALIKDLEKIRPSSILDIVRSGEDMAARVPPEHETEITLPRSDNGVQLKAREKGSTHDRGVKGRRKVTKQTMGKCERCGYLSSQKICKACVLLEGLNKSRPQTKIEVGIEDEDSSSTLMRQVGALAISTG
ncbi:hypothetical protein DV737_g4303, partial [Chaetothyriales sp. CBS 132003]